MLLDLLRRHAQRIDAFDGLIDYIPYAVQYRYDAFDEMGTPLDRVAAIELIDRLLQAVPTDTDTSQRQ
ncbi:MAG: hypothetical protein M1457_12285 [bacterium]|nr:hypothetical protein [bacterium]